MREFMDKHRDTFLLIPLMIAVAVIPLIVRVAVTKSGLVPYIWFSNEDTEVDMFMIAKHRAMIAMDVILLLLYIYLMISNRLKVSWEFIPLGVYMVLLLISSVASVSTFHTLHGFWGMHESIFVAAGYVLLCYYAFSVIQTEEQIKKMLYALATGAIVLGIIGFFQFLGFDFYMSQVGKHLITPYDLRSYIENAKLAFEKGRVYVSLYNPNYVGIYTCMLMPLFTALALGVEQKKTMYTCVTAGCLMLVCMLGSGSKTGVLLLIPSMLLVIIAFAKKRWKRMLVILGIYAAVFVFCNVYQIYVLKTGSVAEKAGEAATKIKDGENYKLTDITLNDDDFVITYDGHKLSVKYLHNDENTYYLELTDENGQNVAYGINADNSGYDIEDERFSDIHFIVTTNADNEVGFSVRAENLDMFIMYSEQDQTYYYINAYGGQCKLESGEKWDCPLFHMFGGLSGRGYIWSKSLPILKKTLLIGSGPDTFAFMYPQLDYVDEMQNGRGHDILTKPHDMYIQMGVQTGVLGLLAFLTFYLIYFVRSVMIYRKMEYDTWAKRFGIAIFIGSISFMMAGVLHDSTCGVSVVYWTLLGIGSACNAIVKKEQ